MRFGDRNAGIKWLTFIGASVLLGLAMITLWQRLVIEISEIVIGLWVWQFTAHSPQRSYPT